VADKTILTVGLHKKLEPKYRHKPHNHHEAHENNKSDEMKVTGLVAEYLYKDDDKSVQIDFPDSSGTLSLTTDLHNRQHNIDSTDDHNGVSGATEGNFLSFDSDGLPQDSGYKSSDYTREAEYKAITILTADENYSVLSTDKTIIYNINGDKTVILPELTSDYDGKEYFIKNIHATGRCTVSKNGTGVDTIDGATSIQLFSQYEYIVIIGDNTNSMWHIKSANY